MKTEPTTDHDLKAIKEKMDRFFATATAADIERLLQETDYEFYRTVTADILSDFTGATMFAHGAVVSESFQPMTVQGATFSEYDEELALAA